MKKKIEVRSFAIEKVQKTKMSTKLSMDKKSPISETKKKAMKLEEQTSQYNTLKELNEQLKDLLREKYPDKTDQEYLGIFQMGK